MILNFNTVCNNEKISKRDFNDSVANISKCFDGEDFYKLYLAENQAEESAKRPDTTRGDPENV